MANAPLVYLDSSDFSVLSSEGRSSEHEALRRDLAAMSRAGEARFVFSGVHLMEMAPIQSGFATRAAAARADLLVELCGRRALLSFDRLWAMELGSLGHLTERPAVSIVNDISEWYPAWDDDLIPSTPWGDLWQGITDETKAQGLNRATRRKVMPKLMRHGRPTRQGMQLLKEQAQTADYDQITRLYPMRDQDARTLGQYFVGQATAAEAKEAFLESLRDPRWMIRWFVAHADTLSAFTEWVRKPGQDVANLVRHVAQKAADLRSFASIGIANELDMLTAKGWRAAQDDLLINIAARARAAMRPDLPAYRASVAEIDRQCPGFAMTVRSAHSAMRASVTAERPRSPKDSDFPDAVHAVYAPYVDVFRADGFMAEHIAAHAPASTCVVPKLSQLATTLRRLAA